MRRLLSLSQASLILKKLHDSMWRAVLLCVPCRAACATLLAEAAVNATAGVMAGLLGL
jgi:hypothetical protein